VANLAHTIGTNAIFVSLYRIARALTQEGNDDAVVEWRNAAACSRRNLRPDGYGIYRHAGKLYGFFLEYDRGTMQGRDYREKFAVYHAYLASGQFQQEYQGYPTILVVTRDDAIEERIARAVTAVAVGQFAPLPLLLTSQWRIDDPHNPYGLLGPIWREVEASSGNRRVWPSPESTIGP